DAVTFVTGSLNVAVIVVEVDTMLAPGAGAAIVTVGGVVSGTVVNVHCTCAASALLARSAMPVVSVTVTTVLFGSAADGVNVHCRPPMPDASVPVTATPSLTVNVEAVTPITGSSKVATIVVFVTTIVALGTGERSVTIGAVVSG